MNNQKSIVGRRYIACGVKAIDLKLNQEVNLGTKQHYTIIDDPYVCEYYRPSLAPLDLTPRKVKMTAVKVRDDRTGLTYAVEYHPANLVCDDRVDAQPGEPADFTTRAVQIAEELKAMFDPAGGGISDKCGVAFFAVSDDGNDETLTSVGFVGGRGDRVSEAIASACSKNPQILEVVKHASVKALFRQIFDGDNKKK